MKLNTRRLMATAVVTCAGGLSVTACSAGITSAGPTASPAPAASRTASPSAAGTSAAAPAPGDTVSVDAPLGSFPVPHQAQVVLNTMCDKEVLIELTSITPAQASAFYLSALPRAGYKITGNSLVTGSGSGLPGTTAEIEFTGHGYTGTMAGVANMGALASGGPSPADIPSNIAANLITISLTPPGSAGCPTPTGTGI
jgi:hypothetical protein